MLANLRHEDRSSVNTRRSQSHRLPYRTTANHEQRLPRPQVGTPHRVVPDSQWLNKRPKGRRSGGKQRDKAANGDRYVLREGCVYFGDDAKDTQHFALLLFAGHAGVTDATDHSRVDRH